MAFSPWELAAIDQAGYNGIKDEHIEAIAEKLLATGKAEIDRQTFNDACYSLGINPDNLNQGDLDRLQEKLNEL